MSGLPGSGKSTIGRALAARLPAALVSVDPIDAALRRAGIAADQPTGLAAYLVAEIVAEDVLAAGMTVLVDAVNAVEPARAQWRELAARRGVAMRVVEVICSDPYLHRTRLESRRRRFAGLPEPRWADVERRRAEFVPWTTPRLVLDSADGLDTSVRTVLDHLGE